MKPLVSICLPNYNYESFLREAIESVLSQTYANFELIIGDNGSTDSSVEIIKSYNDSRIKFYQNPENIPLYQNINKCLSMAKGELITILHSDDKYDHDFLREIVQAYKEFPDQKVFVTGVNIWHFEEGKINSWYPYKSSGIKKSYEVLLRLMFENNIGNGVNVAFHRDCFKEMEAFSGNYKYSADYDLWTRLAEQYDFVYINKILAYYRIHKSNLSHTVLKNLAMLKEGLSVFDTSLYKTKILPKKVKKIISPLKSSALIPKALHRGMQYKSGITCRNMLRLIAERTPSQKFNPYWNLIFILSFLINEKAAQSCLKMTSFLCRLILYSQNLYIKMTLERLVNNNRIYSIQ